MSMGIIRFVRPRHALRLPEDLRRELKKPLGIVKKDFGEIVRFIREKNPQKIVSVGDFVSSKLLERGILPDILVVDFKIERADAPQIVLKILRNAPYREIHVKNAAGTLNPDLWEVLERASDRVRIIVEGEEDLVTIPAVLTSPIGSIVLYGQPGEGTVIIEVTEEKKREFERILERFIPAEVR